MLSIALLLCFVGQEIKAQCDTPPPDYDKVMPTKEVYNILSQKRMLNHSFRVDIYFHLIKNSSGTNNISTADVEAEIDEINVNFAEADICFALVGINSVNNNDYATTDNPIFLTGNTLYPMYGNSNRLDAFIFPGDISDFGGYAFDIPNDYFVMDETALGGVQTLTHEIGHCLNLIHTHQNSHLDCAAPSAALKKEQVDGGNCTTAGDLCCDTPADPDIGGALSSCNYIGSAVDCENNSYNPLENNFMSYGGFCRNDFTQCQIDRMHAELLSGTVGTLYSTEGTCCTDIINFTVPEFVNTGFILMIYILQIIIFTSIN